MSGETFREAVFNLFEQKNGVVDDDSEQRKHPECRHEAERSACCLQCNHDPNQREGNRCENHDQLAEGVELPDE